MFLQIKSGPHLGPKTPTGSFLEGFHPRLFQGNLGEGEILFHGRPDRVMHVMFCW